MKDQLISVIVPVYNVSEYLEDCYRAIAGQTYKTLEIIFVDDGSTDDSGVKCDQFATEDSRVHVIHKINGGLSSARNAGLEITSGDIVSFIDSDDYPRNDMLEKLLRCMTKYQAEIVCCDYSSAKQRKVLSGETAVLKSSYAISMLLNEGGYRCFAWNKLYKRDLFKDIQYPEGELYEDIKTTYQLFRKASKICYLKEDLYFYRTRETSITRTKFTPNSRDLIKAINTVIDDANGWLGRKECNRLIVGYIYYYMGFVKKSMMADMETASDITHLKKCITNNIGNILCSNGISKKIKLEILLFGITPKGFKKLLRCKGAADRNLDQLQ